ncbi:MAG: hypothetical protein IKS34_03540, partial [Clostridia bacterium]|nr:hypothetical protein [Clostridia bacterium]
IIMELKDKIGASGPEDLSVSPGAVQGSQSIKSQVIDTLLLYGFDRQQIENALKSQDLTKPLEEVLANTLRFLGTR